MYATCDVPAFNAYLGDVKLDVHPVQAINDNFTLKVTISFSGGCCGGCGVCKGFHARKIRVTLQIPSELTLLAGNNPQELEEVDGLGAGASTTREALWRLVGSVEGIYAINVTVVSENTIPTEKQASCEVSIVRGLVINQPLIEPISPTPNDDVTVFVNISNPLNIGLKNVTLRYYTHSMMGVMLMHPEVGNDSWCATIPKQREGVVTFYIEVYDINGNSTKSLGHMYNVQDPIRIETWYRNTVSSVTLLSLIGLLFIAFASYLIHRRRRPFIQLGEPTILKQYEMVPRHRILPYDGQFVKSKNLKRRLSFITCLTLGIVLLYLAVYLGQLYEWGKYLGG